MSRLYDDSFSTLRIIQRNLNVLKEYKKLSNNTIFKKTRMTNNSLRKIHTGIDPQDLRISQLIKFLKLYDVTFEELSDKNYRPKR